ncbi:MAG: L,D-transpeptidase family protein [Miltoncostaeaceae bacterium]
MSTGQVRRMARGSLAAMALGALVVAPPAMAQDPGTPPAAPAPSSEGAPAPLARGVIAPGVSIAGVDVSGLTARAARRAVVVEYIVPQRKRLVMVYRGKRVPLDPVVVGHTADLGYAVKAALLFGRSRTVPEEGFDVPLRERVDPRKVLGLLRSRVARFDVAPRDAAFSMRGATPVARDARPGIALNQRRSMRLVRNAILQRESNVVRLPSRRTRPDVVRLPNVIVIDRGSFRLTLWRHNGRNETFPIAVGTSSHPTPSGNYSVIQKQVNPTWFPPSSPWAAGLGPVPPGPANPLGTRWIGTSAPAIGMHGTPSPSSIGTRASHGCIRMYMNDVERLYGQVEIGTPVYIR